MQVVTYCDTPTAAKNLFCNLPPHFQLKRAGDFNSRANVIVMFRIIHSKEKGKKTKSLKAFFKIKENVMTENN